MAKEFHLGKVRYMGGFHVKQNLKLQNKAKFNEITICYINIKFKISAVTMFYDIYENKFLKKGMMI